MIGCGPDLAPAAHIRAPHTAPTGRLFPPTALLRNDRNKQTVMIEIKVPTIAGGSKLSIGRWFKREGDPVTFQEPLVEIDTDSVTREIQAPATGIQSRILVRDGGTVEPGTIAFARA